MNCLDTQPEVSYDTTHLLTSALNRSSSHRYGFEPRSGHMWDKPSSACWRSGDVSPRSPVFSPTYDRVGSKRVKPSWRTVKPNKNQHGPQHDKTNKVTVRSAKTQISLGIRPVWSEPLLCANGSLRTQAFFMRTAKTLIRLGGCPGWSESSLVAHSFCWFCHVVAHLY